MQYCFGFYRISKSIEEATERAILAALHRLDCGFFPAEITSTLGETVLVDSPDVFSRNKLPVDSFVDDETAAFSLSSPNGVQIEITESSDPQLIPASVLVEFSGEVLAANEWATDKLLELCEAVLDAFRPDYAYLFDLAHAERPEYVSRMFQFDRLSVPSGIFWINYFGPTWVENVGRAALERLSSAVPVFKWFDDGGFLFAIQQAPYDEANISHRRAQKNLEDLIGLHQIQAGFPNPGL